MKAVVLEWLVMGGLAFWFAATLAYQVFLRRLIPIAERWDIFRVVPSWHLYTEISPMLRLYFRDRDSAGHISEWREISLLCPRAPGRALFNPSFFAADARLSFVEFFRDAVRLEPPLSPERLAKTVSWQGVWLCVASEPRAANTTSRQFELREQLSTSGSTEIRVFTSEFLPLLKSKALHD